MQQKWKKKKPYLTSSAFIKFGGIFYEPENFQKPGKNGDGNLASLSTICANRKKLHFTKSF